VGDAGDVHVDALAVEGDALGHQVFALPLPNREAAVGAHDPPPGGAIGDLLGREKTGTEARGARRDVAVSTDEALRDIPDRFDDLGVVLVVDAEVLHRSARRPTFSEISLTPFSGRGESIRPGLVSDMGRRFRQAPEQGAEPSRLTTATQAA
jgi:hypothetical protein